MTYLGHFDKSKQSTLFRCQITNVSKVPEINLNQVKIGSLGLRCNRCSGQQCIDISIDAFLMKRDTFIRVRAYTVYAKCTRGVN